MGAAAEEPFRQPAVFFTFINSNRKTVVSVLEKAPLQSEQKLPLVQDMATRKPNRKYPYGREEGGPPPGRSQLSASDEQPVQSSILTKFGILLDCES